MKLIYYPDHDKRYAHIHPDDRRLYPDEVRVGMFFCHKRIKPFKEITLADTIGGLDPVLLANDIPYNEALIRP